MMIETMAGKSAALHGLCHDATPFTFSEDNPAVDYFGKLLLKGLYIHILSMLMAKNEFGWKPRHCIIIIYTV